MIVYQIQNSGRNHSTLFSTLEKALDRLQTLCLDRPIDRSTLTEEMIEGGLICQCIHPDMTPEETTGVVFVKRVEVDID